MNYIVSLQLIVFVMLLVISIPFLVFATSQDMNTLLEKSEENKISDAENAFDLARSFHSDAAHAQEPEIQKQLYFKAFKFFQMVNKPGGTQAQSNLRLYIGDQRISEMEFSRDKVVFEWLIKASQRGNIAAHINLGRMYDEKCGIPEEDSAKAEGLAAYWYTKAGAEKGNGALQFNLAQMYRNKSNIPIYDMHRSDEFAIYWYKKAAFQGISAAKVNLGIMYERKRGITQEDLSKADEFAVYWYSEAAKQEDVIGQYNLAGMYDERRGISEQEISKADELAVYWYTKAAERGHIKAYNNLGTMYSERRGILKEKISKADELAVYWYKKAAEQGDAIAQYNLAKKYENKQGISKEDLPRADMLAIFWHREAAKQEDINAQYSLGLIYDERRGISEQEIPKADELAVYWYTKAAERGHIKAYNNLGLMYANKRGIPDQEVHQADELALLWYMEAALQNEADAQYNLGFMYANKRGVSEEEFPKADQLAVYWYKKAALQEIPDAQINLGLLYANKRGVSEEEFLKADELAVYWYKKAAERGVIAAYNNLGVMYANKRGVSEEEFLKADELAVYWYKKAAEQGDATAQCNLGRMYERKAGISEEDLSKADQLAVYWYNKAAEKGLAEAYNNLGLMYANQRGISEEEIFQSDVLALQWYKKAIQQGNNFARNNLGLLYESGRGISKEEFFKADAIALQLFKEEALRGESAAAQFNLAMMYGDKRGVTEEDLPKADEFAYYWYKKSAELGNAYAQTNLGKIYKDKKGIPEEDFFKADELAIFWYKKAASQGILEAQVSLATIYLEKSGISNQEFEMSTKIALAWYNKAAEQGFSKAQLSLAFIYSHCSEGVKDNNKAAEWLIKAVKQDSSAFQMLGNMYLVGKGVLQDRAKAVNLLKLSGMRENLDFPVCFNKNTLEFDFVFSRSSFLMWESTRPLDNFEDSSYLQLLISMAHEMRHKNIVEAFEEYKEKSLQGLSGSQLKFGVLYYYGVGVAQDLSQAIEWYGESAQRGNIDAQYFLSRTYIGGFGVKNDQNRYERWASKALFGLRSSLYIPPAVFSKNQNDSELQSLLPSSLSNFSSMSTLKRDLEDTNDTIVLYINAAEAGNGEARDILIRLARKKNLQAAAALGHLYADISIERSPTTIDSDVFQWLTAAANQGDIKALYRLGRMHEYGWGCIQDDILAVACFREAAIQWYAPAQKALAEAYRYGKGIKQSDKEALRWYRRSAKQGDAGASAIIKEIADEENKPEAVYALAKAHEEGWGIARDDEEALTLYSQAARLRYQKAQYVSAVKVLECKLSSDDDLEPLAILTNLAGREARVRYFELMRKELNRKERKALKELPEQGYYKAQHKLAELYEKGRLLTLPALGDTIKAYQEAIRLYEAAMKSNKPVALVPLERVRTSLERLQHMTEEDKFKEDHPGFVEFLKSIGKTKEYEPQFLHELAFVFDQASLYEGEVKAKMLDMARSLARLSSKKKQAQSLLQQMTALVSTKAFKEEGSKTEKQEKDAYRLKELSTLDRGLAFIRRSWTLLPLPSECPSSLKVAFSLVHDPRIELFNSYFKFAESKYDPELFQRSVDKIMQLFDRLRKEQYIKEDSFYSEDDDKYGNRETLGKLITHNHKPNNRFAHRLIRIADIVYEQSKKDPSLVASQLIQWAKRGLNCLTASEEEMNRFYIDYMTNTKSDSEALTKEDRTLELQVALSLAKLRYQLLDEIVEEKDEQRIHSVKHLEKKARWALGLLGDAENYTDPSEYEIPLKYQHMTEEYIIARVLERYEPDRIAKHIAKQIDEKVIDYDKIGRRLRFQFIRSKVAPHGELDNNLFESEDYLLDHCTREEFERQILLLQSMKSSNPNNNNTHSIALDWEALKGQSYDKAREQRAEFYDEDLMHVTPYGAKALFYGLGYLERE